MSPPPRHVMLWLGRTALVRGGAWRPRSPSSFGYALLANPCTLVPRCVIGYWDIAALLKNYNPVAQKGTGWSDVNQIGSIYTASFTAAGGRAPSFTFVGGENCKAFLKLGPP
jgi:hypothetical protein